MVSIKERVKVGDRIKLVSMPKDPNPIEPGTEGTVTYCSDLHGFGKNAYQIGVDWENGRTLSLCEEDRWTKIS